MLTNSKILFGLHQMKGVGWKTIAKTVLNYDGHLLRLLKTKEYDISEEVIARQWATYESLGVRVLTYYDDDYPQLLRRAHEPPWVIYCLGDVKLLKKNAIAIVGTRAPTVYGKHVAGQLARDLSERDWCVVSGLARGIDSIAHEGALQGKGRTIAVLGTGINVVYPAEHALLYKQIAANGLLISEFPLHTSARPGHFPMRNRIIAGLSYGTLVVEAAKQSGSLITAALALDNDREVFAVPGPISSPKSAGTHDLIQKGAKLTASVDDILAEFKYNVSWQSINEDGVVKVHAMLNKDERNIIDLLGAHPTTFDELMERSQFNFGHLHSVLLSLTLKSCILQQPGGAYIKI